MDDETSATGVAARYRRFAEVEGDLRSPRYAEWARGVAGDAELLARLATLPGIKQQPNLVFAAIRFVGVPVRPWATIRDEVLRRWADVEACVRTRSTQTNEAGRLATLLPAFAALPQPLALLEIGASMGLCLYPDAWTYRYRSSGGESAAAAAAAGTTTRIPDARATDLETTDLEAADLETTDLETTDLESTDLETTDLESTDLETTDLEAADLETAGPWLTCDLAGTMPPRHPQVVWRAGLDLHPLRADDPTDVAWLETLIWPIGDGRPDTERLGRLHAGVAIARARPAPIHAGDLATDTGPLLAEALAERDAGRAGAAVVFHTAVLAYLPAEARAAFAARMLGSEAVWIANEGIGVVPGVKEQLDAAGVPYAPSDFCIAINGRPYALADAHGRWVRVLDRAQPT